MAALSIYVVKIIKNPPVSATGRKDYNCFLLNIGMLTMKHMRVATDVIMIAETYSVEVDAP